MSDAMDGVPEQLSEVAEEVHEHARVVITVLLLLVTLLVAVTALLAGLASRDASLDQEARAVLTAQADVATQHEAQMGESLNDLVQSAVEARTHGNVAAAAAQAASPSLAPELAAEANSWHATSTALSRGIPSNAAEYLLQQYEPATEAEQQSDAAEQTSLAWSGREDADVAIAALFAVALLLLGVALSVPSYSVKWGFVVVACVLAVAGGAWLLAVNAPSVPHRSPKAISSYAEGIYLREAGDDNAAALTFEDAISADRRYGAAWGELGEALGSGDRPQLVRAASALRRAVALGSTDTAILNDLAWDDLRLGRLADAGRNAGEALATGGDPPPAWAVMTAAEVALGRGDVARANALGTEAVSLAAKYGSSSRDGYFSAWSHDYTDLEGGVIPRSRLDAFFRSVDASEARLGNNQVTAARR
jgi:hypothetical protein